MSYKKEDLIKNIALNLAFSSKGTSLKNVIGLFDSNRVAQDFFCGLFSLVFGYNNLKELDKLNGIPNYPAIDLGDIDNKIAFQITTDSSSDKIKETISKFIKHKLYEKYDKLIIFIIGDKQKSYTTKFNTKDLFVFNKDNDIWDDNFLISEIDKINDIKKLDEISNFLMENLVEFKTPDKLLDSDIKKCIEIFKRDFGTEKLIEGNLNIISRNDDFIKDIKNPLNNISWEFFKNNIIGHIKYNEHIFTFLGNPINKNLQIDYLEVCNAIHKYYLKNKNIYDSFEKVFGEIFSRLNTYNDHENGISNKLKILLHNMYFNCDIGLNS
ncbi:SMEK domain-containing protein [Candidatus Gracilibacteria bacterium]|nr:SMEK domain-containing protein [Candidatus Gracilibacteria bacterium]NUJ99141.1 SMEK domain-containing protein [Candidatus Gracilibacteria bacterium]